MKFVGLRFFAVLCFVLAVFYAQAQQLNYQRYSINEGLPQSEVTDVIEDQRGVLWVGTHNGGLCRFNGKSFEVYTTKNGLTDNYPHRILESRKGDLWIFGDKGITNYDGRRFRKLPHSYFYERGKPKFIIEDIKHSGVFWMLLTEHGRSELVRLAGDSLETMPFISKKMKDQPFFLSQNPDGSLLVTTLNGCFDYYYETAEYKPSYLYTKGNFPADAVFYRAITDKLGRTWYNVSGEGFKTGIYREENDRIEYTNIQYMVDLKTHYGVCSDSNGDLWLSTAGYVVKLSDKGAKYYSKELGLNGEIVSKCCEDRHGNIWVATLGGGLIRYTDDSFLFFDQDDGLPSDYIKCVYADKQENIWMGLSTGSVARYNGEVLTPYFYPGADNVETTNVIFENEDGELCFATNQGLYAFRDGDFDEISDQYRIPQGVTLECVQVEADTVWAYSKQMGFLKLFDKQVMSWNKRNSGLVCDFVYNFSILESGKLWINSDRGAFLFDRKNFRPKISFGKLTQPIVLQVAEGKNNDLWCATFGDGLLHITNDSVQIYDTENSSLNTNIIYSVAVDAYNNVWMGTQKGVSRINSDSLQRIRIRNYDKYDGFKGLECNSGAIHVDKQNRIWFGTIHGAVRFNPKLWRSDMKPPVVHITGVDLYNDRIGEHGDSAYITYDEVSKWFAMPTGLRLEYNQNHLTFHFEGVSHIAPEKMKYKWFLKGFDKRWSRHTDASFAVYSNLPPGEYTFQVKAANGSGVWTKSPILYHFEIEAPFWKRIWFLVLSALAFGFALLFLIRLREKVLKRENDKLEESVRIRTAEILQQKEEIETQRDEIETQRDQIEAQRDEIELQRDYVILQRDDISRANASVTDSIRYAKRIQEAVMSPKDLFQTIFPNSFIFYKPRDIVSGDFYWFRKVGNTFIVAVVDCTGHGVPGAFMSMLGISMMNELAPTSEPCSPSAILEVMREHVKSTLHQKGDMYEQHDGMDMSVITIELDTNILSYAGAHNPAILVRKTDYPCELRTQYNNPTNGVTLYELRATPNPVGIHTKEEPFKEYKMQLYSGDTIYLFSDGFNDQFGGKHGHRYMARRFKRLLVDNYHIPMQEQSDFLNNTLEDWQGELRQIDDVLVVGIRF